MATISTPATFSRVSRWSWSVWPIPVAVSPRRMKMVEKLATKSRLGTRTRRHSARSSSPTATPLTAER